MVNGSLPAPLDSGVSGTQTEGPDEILSGAGAPPLDGFGLAKTVCGLTSSRPRSFGGDVNASFVRGVIQHFDDEAKASKADSKMYSELLADTKLELAEAKTELAVLRERLATSFFVSKLNQITGILGTAAVGISIDLYRAGLDLSYLVAMFGAVIISAPFWLKQRGVKK